MTPPSKAVHDPFKSGWDDTMKSAASLKKQTSFKSKVKVSPLRIPPPALRLPSPTYSDSSAEEENDASFAASTQNYLLSPTGKEALGRVGMIILSPRSQSAVDLDIHAESQQLIRKPTVSQVDTAKIDKHLRPPSHGVPTTPETSAFPAFIPTRPAPPNPFLTEHRPQPPAESPVERAPRQSKSRENLSVSSWPQPPTSIPLSPSPSPTTRDMATPSPTLFPPPTPTMGGGNRDPYYDYVRQPSPTFPKVTLTNRDRAYIFGAPVPTVASPPRVSPPFQSQSTTQVSPVPELKEVPMSKTPVLGHAKTSLVSFSPVIDGNGSMDTASPSSSSFIDSPSIYSTYSGDQNHAAGAARMSMVKETA